MLARASWLARLPPGLFAIPLGILALSGAWRRYDLIDRGFARIVADALLYGGLAVLALLLVLWLARVLREPQAVRDEWAHPVQGALVGLLPVSALMGLVQALSAWPQFSPLGVPLALGLLVFQGIVAWHVVHALSTGRTPAHLVTPALYLPTVPGGFVGAMALEGLGLHGWACLLLGMGVGAWALLEARILHRLFAGPMPAALRSTIGIEMAPAAVGCLTVATLWPQLPADVLMVGLGIASGPVIAVLTRWRDWSELPFSAGFWSFSFPLAAFAADILEAVRRGGWPIEVARLALGLATLVIAWLMIRTLGLLMRGRLLPAPD